MKWISVEVDTPNVDTLGGQEVLIVVNGNIHVATVMGKDMLYSTDNNFLYSDEDGWCGDTRFAQPTHWMPIPEVPNGS